MVVVGLRRWLVVVFLRGRLIDATLRWRLDIADLWWRNIVDFRRLLHRNLQRWRLVDVSLGRGLIEVLLGRRKTTDSKRWLGNIVVGQSGYL